MIGKDYAISTPTFVLVLARSEARPSGDHVFLGTAKVVGNVRVGDHAVMESPRWSPGYSVQCHRRRYTRPCRGRKQHEGPRTENLVKSLSIVPRSPSPMRPSLLSHQLPKPWAEAQDARRTTPLPPAPTRVPGPRPGSLSRRVPGSQRRTYALPWISPPAGHISAPGFAR